MGPGLLPCLYPAKLCVPSHPSFPLVQRHTEQRPDQVPSVLPSLVPQKNQDSAETVVITVICPCWGCLGMQLSHRLKMLLVTGSFRSDHRCGVWELQMQIFFHLYFLSPNKLGSSEASDVHISASSEKLSWCKKDVWKLVKDDPGNYPTYLERFCGFTMLIETSISFFVYKVIRGISCRF